MQARITEDFFNFFKKLAANNHKDWFDENKKWYEDAVKKPFEILVSELLAEWNKTDKSFGNAQPKDCIFRIHRDVRFSKDKTPYKTYASAIVAPGGKKDMHMKGYYLELGPGECALYAGVYMPEKQDLAAIRKHIAGNLKKFDSIINEAKFVKTFGEVLGETQKRLDAELRDAAEKQPLLFNKQFYIKHEFPTKTACSKDFVKYLTEVSKVAVPFHEFLNKGRSLAAND